MKSFLRLALWAAVLSSCAHGRKITNAEICAEIPFVDGPEGACIETVTRVNRLYNAEEWAARRPYMLMIHAKSWTEIKKDWLQACRIAGPDCNVQVDTIDSVIRAIDEILKKVIPMPAAP